MRLTIDGYRKLKKRIAELEANLRHVSRSKGEAVKDGSDSWHDNFSFEQLSREEIVLTTQIKELRSLLDRAEIVECEDSAVEPTKMEIGVSAEIEWSDGTTQIVKVVDPIAADPLQGLISYRSALGEALLNAEVGKEFAFVAPNGRRRCFILKRLWRD